MSHRNTKCCQKDILAFVCYLGKQKLMRMLLKNFVTRYKRFSTKFTHEQRKKMLDFAMTSGWKIKNNYQNVVEEFCNEI
ncbi:putative transcription regulator Homeodomain-LIKE family [Medicago truncatula]|uniref:Putative transcription regulator Homeodomain-LIKE family n=1 Tax=Medicago truncatula TaxID=3880 RepID=A0A396GFW7_MEDTR|nr:putative transcription regulator Homeodomain-LIKE family [Medicago truncatula]